MHLVVVSFIGLAALAFGAVYPWAYVPLLTAAGLLGIAGLRHGVPPDLRPLAMALLLLWAVVCLQLLPLPPAILNAISPNTMPLAASYNIAAAPDEPLPLSVDPAATRTAVLALAALSLYVLGLPALLGRRSLRAVPSALAAFAVPLALFAVYTREHNNNLMYGFWEPLDGNAGNQAGPFINRNHFAGWMVMATCLMVGWLLGHVERALRPADARRRRSIARMFSEDTGRVLLMSTAVALAAISVFWVVSRSAILSLSMAIALFAWLVVARRRLAHTRRSMVIAALAVVLLAGVGWRGVDVLIERFTDERSLLSRLDAWRDGWLVVRDFPLFGTGLNTYSPAMLFYQQRNPGFHLAQAHNDYLQLLAEGGIVVAIPAALAVVMLARAVRRTLRAAAGESRGYWIRAGAAVGMLAIACQEAVEFSLQIPANALLFSTLAAMATAPVRSTTAAALPEPRDRIAVATTHPSDAALS